MSVERIRSHLELPGSQETSQVGKEHPNCGFPSYWAPWTNSLLLCTPFPREFQWCDLETFVFCARLLLGCSSQFSLSIAASFRSLFRVVIFYWKKWTTSKTKLSFHEGNQLVNNYNNCRKVKENWLIIILSSINKNCVSYFRFSYLKLFLDVKQNCLLAKSRYKLGKALSQNTTSKAEMPTLAGNKHLSIHFFPHTMRPFHLSTENRRA